MPNSKPTQFQKDVWEAIDRIPLGETRTYKELALSIGRPKAYRAVANACGKNPSPVSTPCHRVISSDGTIGGYSGEGGINRKKSLLKKEGILFD